MAFCNVRGSVDVAAAEGGQLEDPAADLTQQVKLRPAAATGEPQVVQQLGAGAGTRQDGWVRIVVLSDTHAPRRWKACPPAVARRLRGADLILHAGDVCNAAVLDELSEYAPVHAVEGNNDGPDVAAWGAPPVLELDVAGLAVAMIHDSGPRAHRLERLRRRFPAARLVVFGHSHIPLDETDGEFRIFNPGSPTDRRRQPEGTIGVLRVDDGRVVAAQIVPV